MPDKNEKIQEIVVDTGLVKYAIREKTTKEYLGVIAFNPADFNILKRFDDAKKKIEKAQLNINEDIELDDSGNPKEIEYIKIVNKVNKIICDAIDYIFDAQISKIVFGNKSPLAIIGGKLLFEVFLEAVQPIIQNRVGESMKNTEIKTSKYTSKYNNKK